MVTIATASCRLADLRQLSHEITITMEIIEGTPKRTRELTKQYLAVFVRKPPESLIFSNPLPQLISPCLPSSQKLILDKREDPNPPILHTMFLLNKVKDTIQSLPASLEGLVHLTEEEIRHG